MNSDLLQETGDYLLLEDGGRIILNDLAEPEFSQSAIAMQSFSTLAHAVQSSEAVSVSMNLASRIAQAGRQSRASSVSVSSVSARVRV